MCNKTIVFVVFAIFDWSLILILTCGQGQLDRQEYESAKIFAIPAFFLFFFLILKVADAQELNKIKNACKI